jgi:hypothetical protein
LPTRSIPQVQQLAGRAAQAIELGHDHDIAGLERGREFRQLRPIGTCT